MRTHRVFPALQPWLWRTELVRELAVVERLVAARIEPVARGREPTAFVDLHFSDGERSIVIPLVYVDLAQLELRESDPLVFPHGILGTVSDDRARAIVERLFPDLERQAMTGGFWSEGLLTFGNGATSETARAAELFGAAPLSKTLPRIAPAVYARRFAFGKHIVAYGPQACELAAFLSGAASSCTVFGADGASVWYGEFEAALPGGRYDLAIGAGPPPVTAAVTVRTDTGDAGLPVTVVAPLPATVMISFDENDGPVAGRFSVASTREPFVRPLSDIAIAAALGGSAGKIGIVVRPDAAAAPDSDTAEAAILADALRREGFTVQIVSGVDELGAFAPDLVHLFGVRPGGFARRIADWASENRRPLAVHALYESPSAGGYWGTMVAPYCFGYSADDRSVSAYLDIMGRRQVEVDGVNAMTPYAPAIAELADSERVLALADLVLVNSARELAVVEAFRPRRPTFVVGPVPVVTVAGGAIGAATGFDPFILVHAPIWPEANQLLLARVAADVGVAMVFAGAVADPAYAERLREFAPATVSLLAEPALETIATLYRSASVVADVAWTARGHGRLATAAAFGAAVVSSQSRWLDLPDEHRWVVDPADVRSVARGVGEAWDASVRGDPRIQATAKLARERLETATAAIVAAYAKIAPVI